MSTAFQPGDHLAGADKMMAAAAPDVATDDRALALFNERALVQWRDQHRRELTDSDAELAAIIERRNRHRAYIHAFERELARRAAAKKEA